MSFNFFGDYKFVFPSFIQTKNPHLHYINEDLNIVVTNLQCLI